MTLTTEDLTRLQRHATAAAAAETAADRDAAEIAALVRARVTEALRWLPIDKAIPAVADALCDWAAIDPDAVAQAASRALWTAAEVRRRMRGGQL